jgi:arginyl-tRNA--protein-N-Asp/Glu arginylyltransferase
MHIIKARSQSENRPCSYLADQTERHEYFLASAVNGVELDQLWHSGHRKFGPYFFRPSCESCQACIPLRIPVDNFLLSKSQRRIMRKNADVQFGLHPLEFREDVFDLYNRFIAWRFKKAPEDEEQFRLGLTTAVGASAIALYHIDGELVAFGMIDLGASSMSSVYFAYAPEWASRSLGTLGAILEIYMAKQLGLKYYYLGFWVEKCAAMSYKTQFRPYELLDSASREWKLITN